jgi:hypothetical protein
LNAEPGILELQHLQLLELAQVQIALVPTLEVRELIVGRKKRMRFAIAFDLGGLVQDFPFRAGLGIFAIDLLAGSGLDDREHAPVAQIAVVRNGEQFAAGLFFVRGHPLPQVARIVAAQRLLRGERLDPARLVTVVPEDHVAVQVVPSGVRGPLEADEGGKSTRVVGLLCGLDGFPPGRTVRGSPGTGNRPASIVPCEKLTTISIAASAPFPDCIMSYHLRPCGNESSFASPPNKSGKKPKPSE